MLRSAADLRIPMVAVSLLHRKGYFDQRLDSWATRSKARRSGHRKICNRLAQQVTLTIEGRPVHVGAWHYLFIGISGHIVPLIFWTRSWRKTTPRSWLDRFSLRRRRTLSFVPGGRLGNGRRAMLRALGYADIRLFHMNEGHSAWQHWRFGRTHGACENVDFPTRKSRSCAGNAFLRLIRRCRRATIVFQQTWCPGFSVGTRPAMLNAIACHERLAQYD